MNESKLILTNNIHIVLSEFQEALQQGYRFTNQSDLVTSMMGLNELYLYKEEMDIPVVSYEDAVETVTVSGYDKNDVLKGLQVYLLNGYSIAHVIDWFQTSIKSVVVHNPEHPNCKIYGKEELIEMDYNDLKVIGKLRNCFARSRDVMINGILKYQS